MKKRVLLLLAIALYAACGMVGCAGGRKEASKDWTYVNTLDTKS